MSLWLAVGLAGLAILLALMASLWAAWKRNRRRLKDSPTWRDADDRR